MDVTHIDRRQLREKLERHDDFKLVMAASDFGFKAKHIQGSLHFKTDEQMFATLGKDEVVVVYCSNVDCHASLAVVEKLQEHGYTRVLHYPGGLVDWEEGGLPIEGEWAPNLLAP
jgi:rhodanese-related sulfurtransferase